MKIYKEIKKHTLINNLHYFSLNTDLYPDLKEPKEYPCVLVAVKVVSEGSEPVYLKQYVYEKDFLPF